MRIATLIATVVLGAGVVSAQSLGDVARQERVRRAGLEKHSAVLTNEDLSRPQILSPDAREAAAWPTASAAQPAPGTEARALAGNRQAAPAAPATQWERQEVSLGEYARAIRVERARREAAANPGQLANANPEPSATVGSALVADSSVPAWTAAEQPGFSLGEYARAQRALHGKDVPVQLTLDAKAAPAAAVPAPRPTPSLTADRRRKTSPAHPAASPTAAAILVQAGDSLWKLSRTQLGDGRLWTAIWAANPQVQNPDLIHPGQSLSRPTEVQLAAAGQAFSGKSVMLAKLAPARRAARSVRLRSVGLPLAGNRRHAAARIAVRRVATLRTADLDRLLESESYDSIEHQLLTANRSVVSNPPGHGGLR